MQCTTNREQLLEPVMRAEKATGKNHTLPILACILLEVSGDRLSLTATNLEVGVTYSVPVKNTTDGTVAVAGSVLAQVVGSLSSGAEVSLKVDEGGLVVESVGGSSRIAAQDTEEFPALPQVDGGEEITLPAKLLKDAITSVSYCASTSTIKPELSSVFIHPNNSELIATATDSFRLAEKRVPLKDSVQSDPFLVPAKSTHELVKVLEQAKDTVTLLVGEHQLSLMLPGVYMTLRLVNGTFPDYTQIIPKEFATEATLLAADLDRTLKKAAIFSDQFNQTTLSVEPKNKVFTVHTEHQSVGETTDSLSAALEGEELTIRFNQRYLMDALHSISADSVTVQFAGQSHPAVVRPVGDTTFLYLVMPMNR